MRSDIVILKAFRDYIITHPLDSEQDKGLLKHLNGRLGWLLKQIRVYLMDVETKDVWYFDDEQSAEWFCEEYEHPERLQRLGKHGGKKDDKKDKE